MTGTVVSHYEGEHEGRQFLVLELVEGRSLRNEIDGQSLKLTQALKVV